MKANIYLLLLCMLLVCLTACPDRKLVTDPPNRSPLPETTAGDLVQFPAWSKDKMIYEVNLRQYTEEGSLAAFSKHLPRLQEMGVGILWLMPIHPIGEQGRKGGMGSYYSVKDYKGIDPSYGTLADMKNFVQTAHEMGMYVIIDWVANHSAWDNPLTVAHPEWYTKDEKGNFVPPVPDWSDVIDFNFDNKDLWEYMIGAMEYWVRETNIDGYRCDVAGMVPLDFWKEARSRLNKVREEPIFMLAEAEETELHEAFEMSYAWEFHHLMNKVAKGEKNVRDIDAYLAKDVARQKDCQYRMLFTSNHDENSWNGTVFERMGESVFAFGALTATLPGMHLIYSGQEAANNKRLAFFEKDVIDWKNFSMSGYYQTLNQFKSRHPALWNGCFGGDYTRIETGNDAHILAFKRSKPIGEGATDEVWGVFNLTNQQQSFTLPAELAGAFHEVNLGVDKQLEAGEEVLMKGFGYWLLER